MGLSGSRTMKVAQYCLLPQILPRFAALFFSGFSYFAYFIAQVYRGVRLLPEGHPFLNPAEIGNYSIPDVVFEAGRHLKHRRENIDQIIIYYVIMLGLLLMTFQVLFLLIGMFAPQAMAFSLTDYFGDSHKTGALKNGDQYQDLAFIMLDRVFGVPGIFQSCVSEGQPCYMAAPDDTWNNASTIYTPPTFPWPFHLALQAMFAFYSTGLLVIALMILLYFVIVIVAETAQTGTPFGRRFNKVWAPLRLVMALGLLIPISNGLNSAQYIVLYSAKLGSNFATNGWNQFNTQLSSGMMSEYMVALPKTPDIKELLRFMMFAHACKAVQEGVLQQENDVLVSTDSTCGIADPEQKNDAVINAYLVKSTGNGADDAKLLELLAYDKAKEFFDNGDMTIRIGDRGCSAAHNKQKGHVNPLCGELMLSMPTQETDTTAGAYTIQKGYYDLIQYLWGGYAKSGSATDTAIWAHYGFCNTKIGGNVVHGITTSDYPTIITAGKTAQDKALRVKALYEVQQLCPFPMQTEPQGFFEEPTSDWLNGTYNNYMYGDMTSPYPAYPADVNPVAAYSPNGTATAIMTNIIRQGVEDERALILNGKYGIEIDLLDRGWAGAGLWYNKIAAANGAITGAAQATPQITHFPELMEWVAQAKLRNNANVSAMGAYAPTKGKDESLQARRAGEEQAANAMAKLYDRWVDVGVGYKPATGNIIYDIINSVFGTQGLFDLRDPGNANVHPLALLTSMGKSLLEASIRNMVAGAVMNLGGGAEKIGGVLQIGGSLAFMIVGMTMGAGIILYYVLPFMPFLYFFFAVGSWIKSVFEAMVAVPLWALAHIRIDGDGLPGSAALNGYYLIFEIFLRPIMTVFGLIAAVSIFAAMATVLNAVFDIAVVNVGGANFANKDEVPFMEWARGPIDQLFYTVMYAVILYIMALASFKMIDLIPNQVMRWMGASVSSFASMTGGDAQGVVQTMQTQGTGSVQQAVGGLNQTSRALGTALGGLGKSG